MRFLVAQLGARMHYAIPRILNQAGMLERFYTDICATKGIGRLVAKLPSSKLPKSLKRLQARIPDEVPQDRIITFDQLGVQYAIRHMLSQNMSDMTKTHLWAGKAFTRAIIENGLGNATRIYAFNTAGLELLRHAKINGLITVIEQTVAPMRIQESLMQEERERNPLWETKGPENKYLKLIAAREEEEWHYADIVLCGSEFVRQGISMIGGPVQRCRVVPYGVDKRFTLGEKKNHSGPLRVLTVGQIGLRKGIPDVLESACRLRGKAVFRIVGDISITEQARIELAAYVELTGIVSRSEITQHYAWADVFLLPSICEGSATVVYEALAAGLPVICTPNTGSVVQDGVDGFVVPIRDPDAICEKLVMLFEDKELLQEMSKKAGKKASQFTLEEYQQRLLSIIGGI